jgi:hypothetical protein
MRKLKQTTSLCLFDTIHKFRTFLQFFFNILLHASQIINCFSLFIFPKWSASFRLRGIVKQGITIIFVLQEAFFYFLQEGFVFWLIQCGLAQHHVKNVVLARHVHNLGGNTSASPC